MTNLDAIGELNYDPAADNDTVCDVTVTVDDYPPGWLENDLDPATAESQSDRDWIALWNASSLDERAQLLAMPSDD